MKLTTAQKVLQGSLATRLSRDLIKSTVVFCADRACLSHPWFPSRLVPIEIGFPRRGVERQGPASGFRWDKFHPAPAGFHFL